MNSKLSSAIAAILGGVSFGAAAMASPADVPQEAATATAPSASSDSLQEITVTAQRRSESMQDVPISMQAFTAETLQQLNIPTFDDYIKYLPNVTTASNGPGPERGLHARPERRLAGQPGQRLDRLVAERRHLPGQPIRPAAESQPRHLCRGPESHRGSGGPAGHPVRRRRRGRRDPLHHQRAEARRDRGQRQGRLRSRPPTATRTPM